MNPDLDVHGEMRKMPSNLPSELVMWEILVWLPVKSLLRFRCACKAWRDTISGDASFSQAHVRRHQPQKRRPSSLLIAPCIEIGDLMDKYAIPGLYLWEENQRPQDSTLVHDDMASYAPEHWAQTRHEFAHCDGLVMLPDAEGTVRVLNPATRRSLTLPWSPNSTAAQRQRFGGQNAFGFGRDPTSGAYKVARFFDRDPRVRSNNSLGMEVFTIGEDRCWRETTTKPPYRFIMLRTATFFKGSLIWTVNPRYHDGHAAGLPRIVRFSLEDESFRVVLVPPWYSGPDYKESRLIELHGKLALARLSGGSVEIWMCDNVEGVNPPLWARHHVLNFLSPIHLIAAFDDGIVFRDRSYDLYRLTSEGSEHMVSMKKLKYRNPDTDTFVERSTISFDGFDVVPYIPTLVQI